MIPWWVAAAAGAMLLGFGVFLGYAIAGYQDLRRIERNLDRMEREADKRQREIEERGW